MVIGIAWGRSLQASMLTLQEFFAKVQRNLSPVRDQLSCCKWPISSSVPKGTLYNLVYERRIPFVKCGRSLRFDAEEVIRSLPHYGKIESAGQRWKGH
jgi:hypothetical protein